VPSNDEQIRAILSYDAFRWAVENLPHGKTIDDIRFRELVTISEEDVLNHVRRSGFPVSVVAEGEAARWADDRICLVEDGDRWSIFYTERGERSDLATVESHAAAQRWVVHHLFENAKVSLNHRWWHAHPDERPQRIGDMD